MLAAIALDFGSRSAVLIELTRDLQGSARVVDTDPNRDTAGQPIFAQVGLSATGRTSAEIARELGLSPRTVNQHVENVAEKLGTKNRTHTIAELMRHHLLA